MRIGQLAQLNEVAYGSDFFIYHFGALWFLLLKIHINK